MTLKILPEDYDKLAELIAAAKVQSDKIEVKPGSKKLNAVQYAWHLWHVAFLQARQKHSAGDFADYQFIYKLQKYLNDDHIQSALLRITK